MVTLGQSHPELVRRYNLLVNEVWAHGWEIGVTSSSRSRATQEDLYRRWLAGTYKVPSVANPNNPHGPSPWGWTIVGSYHMPQADGFSHALDLNWRGCTPSEFETLANRCGLQRTVPNENWHYQWFNRQVIFPCAAAEPPPREEDKVVVIIVADSGDQTWWVTDFVTKRPLADGTELTVLSNYWGVKTDKGAPVKWPRSWVDAIPAT